MATYPDLMETTGFMSVCPERAHVVTDIDLISDFQQILNLIRIGAITTILRFLT